MLIEKPVGIRQKRASVNDGEEGEKDSVRESESESESDRKTCLTGQFSIIEEPLQNHKPVGLHDYDKNHNCRLFP